MVCGMRLFPDIDGCEWEEGCVYYILSGETGRIKIGYTNGDPNKRLKTLQTGSPTKLSIIAWHPGTIGTEQRLHEQFDADRVHGEWFDFSDDLIVHLYKIFQMAIAIHRTAGVADPEWATIGIERIDKMLEDDQDAETLQ